MPSFKRILFALTFAALPLLAEEGGTPPSPDLVIWKWVNFVILAVLLAYIAVKAGGPALRARSKEIGEGLAAGEKAKADADARAAEVQAKLANLEKEIAAMHASAREELNREADRIRTDAGKEIARIQMQLEQETESAAKLAKLEVRRYAAKLAIDLAEQKVRARMSPDVQSALLESFLKDFPGVGAMNILDAAATRESHPRES
jgi:F-type H+-transporting ATPase subunit b